jgi:hypothetical protein
MHAFNPDPCVALLPSTALASGRRSTSADEVGHQAHEAPSSVTSRSPHPGTEATKATFALIYESLLHEKPVEGVFFSLD